MKFTIATALLPLFAASTSASIFTCRTELGSKSIKNVPTDFVTKTKSIRPTVTTTVTPVTTEWVRYWYVITKLTTTTQVVTDSTVTDTFSTTTTLYDVATNTITSTLTATATDTSTTSSTSTTIVPTASGWRPIADTVNRNSLARRADESERGLEHLHAIRAVTSKKPGGLVAASWPSKVHCTQYAPNKNTKTVTKTKPPMTQISPYWQKTTKTKTFSSTFTVVPSDVSTTETYSSTSSVTTFVTTFTTQTSTVNTTTTSIIPGPTIYNACTQANNMFGSNFNVGGVGYYITNIANNGPGVASDFKIVADGASTATECCSACHAFNGCETWSFRPTGRSCFLLYHAGSTCSAQTQHPNFFLAKKGADTGAGYVVGNGNCGFTYSGNSDSSVWRVDGY
ncbi:hypothetical protein P171DRAFT_520279 [Karstenula rhodostoma CBS 690.94]|uniref:Apple domain-containing protein n=1 Tax=Karstenula rhodostoma CBS 690.94 TaxID=1392251 RepID=A0A9P4PJU7_9PLEO|nr:hypothetical protein P171DRAFT_520279 [Karstenula rhodostoma CBS 690.94]